MKYSVAMLKITGLIAAVLTLGVFALADEPRHQNSFISSNGQFEAKLQKDWKWNLIEKSTGKELYSFDDYYGNGISLSSMTLVISDDGRSVVAVNDFGEQDYRKNPEVIFFFQNGKQIKTYKLLEVANPKFMELSASHFRWLYSVNSLSIRDSTLEITTFDMNHLVFNTETGSLIRKNLDDLLLGGTIFIAGPIRPLESKSSFEISVKCSVVGNVKVGSKIKFDSGKFRWIGGTSYESIILRNGKLVERKGVIFNNCY